MCVHTCPEIRSVVLPTSCVPVSAGTTTHEPGKQHLPGYSVLQGGGAAHAGVGIPSLAAARGVRCGYQAQTAAGHSWRIKYRIQFVLSLKLQSVRRVT